MLVSETMKDLFEQYINFKDYIYPYSGEEKDSKIFDSTKEIPTITFSKLKEMQNNNPMNKFKKDTKIIMNKKVQTSKNFFLDFPKQKNALHEKFKEIDDTIPNPNVRDRTRILLLNLFFSLSIDRKIKTHP